MTNTEALKNLKTIIEKATRQAEERVIRALMQSHPGDIPPDVQAAWIAGWQAGMADGRNNQRIEDSSPAQAEPVAWALRINPTVSWTFRAWRREDESFERDLQSHNWQTLRLYASPTPVAEPGTAEPVAWQSRCRPLENGKPAGEWSPWTIGRKGPQLHSWEDEERPLYAVPVPGAERELTSSVSPDILMHAPQFEGCETPEPSLSAMIYRYYRDHFEQKSEADRYAALYIQSLMNSVIAAPTPGAELARVRREALEEAAKVCDQAFERSLDADQCADAIRALEEKK